MILDETFEAVKRKTDIGKFSISDIYISDYFNLIKLNDSSVGAAMNYNNFKTKENVKRVAEKFIEIIKKDKLLIKTLFRFNTNSKLKFSLKTALLGALSKKLLDEFKVENKFDNSIFSEINSATIIGFGGLLDTIITRTKIKNIHVADLFYESKKEEMEKVIKDYRIAFPEKKITISDGADNKERIGNSELVSITGSALCNGTMDNLLNYSRNCIKIIVQGSSFIYPEILFKRGVSLIETTASPQDMIDTARKDPAKLKFLLEGNLPHIYITPRRL